MNEERETMNEERETMNEKQGTMDGGRRHGPGGGVWVGVSLVLLGVLFILHSLGIARLAHWWALFILIPALASVGTAVSNLVRNGGRFTRSVSGPLVGAMFCGAVALILLFSLDWGRIWPVFIVIAGLGMLMNTVARRG
jgi:hypothetical protein